MKARNPMTGATALPRASTNPALQSHYRWDEPDTHLTVLLNPETADRLQTAALASTNPRQQSGDEVGGILLGRTEPDRNRMLIVVQDFEPVLCEHRSGSSYYSLSSEEAAVFASAMTWAKSRRDLRPVGYYRSHVRSGLFLSADDLELIDRHFRDPENVFLLIKPLSNVACTAGFFFWRDGRIQAEFTGSEVPLIPLAAPPARAERRTVAPPPSVATSPAIEPALAQTARWSDPGLRRTAGYVCIGLALVASAGVLSRRVQRPATHAVAPQIAKPELGVTESQSQPAKAAHVSHQAHKSEIRPEASRVVETAKPAAERIPVPTRTFVPPSRPVLPSPGEPTINSEPPVSLTAPTLAAAPAIPGPIVEGPASPPPRISPADTRPVSSPAVVAPRTFTPPQAIHQVTPAVPRGVAPEITSEVQVEVELAIDTKGKVSGARIKSTRGAAAELLTIEALKAAQLFRFRPAEENGHAVAGVTIVTFRFAPTVK